MKNYVSYTVKSGTAGFCIQMEESFGNRGEGYTITDSTCPESPAKERKVRWGHTNTIFTPKLAHICKYFKCR